MKNKKTLLLIICIVLLSGLIILSVFLYKDHQDNYFDTKLIGYYKLEKIVSYYKIDNEEKTNEQTIFYNDRKLSILEDKIESKILNTDNYYYLTKDNLLYYSLNKLDTDKLDTEQYYEYEINNDYLILVRRNDIIETYYYKKITKEEY